MDREMVVENIAICSDLSVVWLRYDRQQGNRSVKRIPVLHRQAEGDGIHGSNGGASARYQKLLLRNNRFIENHSISKLDEIIDRGVAVYQKILDYGTGCLTFNGFNSRDEPATMSIKFVREKDGWKIDYPYMMYWNETDEFPEEASCPATDYGE